MGLALTVRAGAEDRKCLREWRPSMEAFDRSSWLGAPTHAPYMDTFFVRASG